MIKRFVVYGMSGVFMEIVWTGLNALLRGDITLTGHTSVIMFFIYGGAVFLEPLFSVFKGQYVYVRIVTYSVFIFMAEYFSGRFLMSLGMCPWAYYSTFNISNVIRLDYIVLWMAAGYVYERLYFYFVSHNLLQR